MCKVTACEWVVLRTNFPGQEYTTLHISQIYDEDVMEMVPDLYGVIITELKESSVFAKMCLAPWQIALFEEAVKDGRSVWIELTTVVGPLRIKKSSDPDPLLSRAILRHLQEKPDQRLDIAVVTSSTFTGQMFTELPPPPKPPNSTTTLSVSASSAANAPLLRLPVNINDKGFLRTDDSLYLRGDTLAAIKKWHSSLATFGRVNGVYIPPWNEYSRNKKYGRSWTEDFLGPKKKGQIHHMSQLLNMILLRESVVPSSIQAHVDTADGDGYQALYNIICRHHPNTSVSNMVQTSCPRQGASDSFPAHVCNVQLYVAAENSRGRRYSEKEEVALVMSTLHAKYKEALMHKVRIFLTTEEPLPYELHLPTMAPTLEEWTKELELDYNPTSKSTSTPSSASPYSSHRQVHALVDPLDYDPEDPIFSAAPDSYPVHVLHPLAEEQVLNIMRDPKASRCSACHLTGHTQADCHALINHAVAGYLLANNKKLHQQILSKHTHFIRSRRRTPGGHPPSGRHPSGHRPPPSRRPQAKEIHNILDSFASLSVDDSPIDPVDPEEAPQDHPITRLALDDDAGLHNVASVFALSENGSDVPGSSSIHVVTQDDMAFYDSICPSVAGSFQNSHRPPVCHVQLPLLTAAGPHIHPDNLSLEESPVLGFGSFDQSVPSLLPN